VRHLSLIVGLCLLIGAPGASAQQKKKTPPPKKAGKHLRKGPKKPKPPVLNLELVARDTTWCDRSPRYLGWSADGKTVYFTHSIKDKTRARPVFAYDIKSRKSTKLSLKQVWSLPPSPYPAMGSSRRGRGGYIRNRMCKNRKHQVFTRNSDLILLEVATGKERRLTRTNTAESGARFSGDGKRIFFLRGGNFYALSLEDSTVRQLTELRAGPRPKKKKPDAAAKTDLQKTLFKQQKDLFKWIKERRRVRDASDKRREQRKKYDRGEVKVFYTSDGSRPSPVTISPNGRYVVLRLSKAKTGAGKRTVVPTYITESGFVETRPSRTKVGEPVTVSRYGILDLKKNKMKPIDPEPLRIHKPSYMGYRWSPDGRTLAVLGLAQDYRTRWLLSINPSTAKAEVVDALHDPAWIGGPAWSRFGWMKDSRTLWFISEATGYAHLYTADRSGRFRNQLTEGKFEVQNVRLSWNRDQFYLITNERHPGERHLYTMPSTGGKRRCLTGSFKGIDDAAFSPDEKMVMVKHSTPAMPASLTLVELSGAKRHPRVKARIFRGATDAYRSLKWLAPEVVHFPDKHGNLVYARLYSPPKPRKEKAAVIHVHGAGYAQYAHKRWQGRPFTFLFGQYLLGKGYYFLDLDYRGSSGYGRDCRTEIYRYMGGTEVDSGDAAIRYLMKKCGVDRKRVGLFGGSYGGFYTLMALFTRPGLFRAGVALYPVTDWNHYNHWYTSRILNLPQEDRDAYRRSSPIFLAKNLKDRLQIQHGVVDSNVHFQDTMRLVQRLIELKKTGWDLVSYPVEGHGWRTEESRLDSFRRMEKVFDNALLGPGLE